MTNPSVEQYDTVEELYRAQHQPRVDNSVSLLLPIKVGLLAVFGFIMLNGAFTPMYSPPTGEQQQCSDMFC